MNKNITLSLTKEEAIVLFEFVSRFTQRGSLTIQHLAEEKVLWNICADLEKILTEPFQLNWSEILQHAQNTIKDTSL